MLNSINEETINNVVSTLASAIASIKTEIDNLETKYMKLLEEAKSSLSEALSEAESQYQYWLAVRGDSPVPGKKTRRSRAKKAAEPAAAPEPAVNESEEIAIEDSAKDDAAEEDGLIVDTIFDVNNTEEEEPVSEVNSTVEEDLPEEWDEEASDSTAGDDDINWSHEKKDEAPVKEMDDADWPEYPEEWNL